MTTLLQKVQQLTFPGGFLLETTGLTIQSKPSFAEWKALMDSLGWMEGAVQFWIGDALNYGERVYGEMYAQAVDDQQADTWKHYAWVARSIEKCRRRHLLRFNHHQEVANLSAKEQTHWLDWATKNNASVHTLRKEIRTAKYQQSLKSGTFPKGKYRVIYADPPWEYGDTREGLKSYGPADKEYPTLSIEELIGRLALRVRELAADNSVLFLWVTVPMATVALDVIEAWGFEYKTQIVWDKVGHNFGHYTSVRHELLYICTRGSCLPDSKKLEDSVVTLEKSKRHSVKPEFFRTLIDKMYVGGPRVELFARREAAGWDVWGNEVSSDG